MSGLSILMLHRKPYPCSHAMLETVYTRILPSLGYEITWVMPSGQDSSIRGWKLAEWNGTRVYLLSNDSQSNPLQKLVGRFYSQLRVVQHILKTKNVDILQVRNDWIGGLVGAYVQRRRGVPFVFQVSFPAPEWWLAMPGWGKVIGLLWKMIERFLVNQAALVFPISPWMEDKFATERVPRQKMVSLPLGMDSSAILPESVGEQMRCNLGLVGLPVVIYFGEMGCARQLDFLLRAFAHVLREIPNAYLLMVGKSDRGEEEIEFLKTVAADLAVGDRVIFTGEVPRADVPRYILAANVGVSPIVPLPAYQISSPTKLVETLGLGRPLVGNREILDHRQVLEESGGGLYPPYQEEAFAQDIVWLLRHPQEARDMGRKGQIYVLEHRSYEKLAIRVDAAYQALMERRSSSRSKQ